MKVILLFALFAFGEISVKGSSIQPSLSDRETSETLSSKGIATGRGEKKADAYVNALSKVPKGATAGQVSYTGSEKSKNVTCQIKWTK